MGTILTGVICGLVAGAFPINLLGELVSIGTLLAFVIVCGGVWYLRVKEPTRERPFRTPMVPLVPILGILVCGAMMVGLPLDTWLRLIVWLVVGLAIYFFYGRSHSILRGTVADMPGGWGGPNDPGGPGAAGGAGLTPTVSRPVSPKKSP
jgi:APA family basic amino acid/polyamine antiporter